MTLAFLCSSSNSCGSSDDGGGGSGRSRCSCSAGGVACDSFNMWNTTGVIVSTFFRLFSLSAFKHIYFTHRVTSNVRQFLRDASRMLFLL